MPILKIRALPGCCFIHPVSLRTLSPRGLSLLRTSASIQLVTQQGCGNCRLAPPLLTGVTQEAAAGWAPALPEKHTSWLPAYLGIWALLWPCSISSSCWGLARRQWGHLLHMLVIRPALFPAIWSCPPPPVVFQRPHSEPKPLNSWAVGLPA